jgi:hypothetical protein
MAKMHEYMGWAIIKNFFHGLYLVYPPGRDTHIY